MDNPIRNYFIRLQIAVPGNDPTVPFDNEFHLLGLDEGETDDEIARKAKALAEARSLYVDKIGQRSGTPLEILFRTKIGQAGSRFTGQPANVRKHRDELQKLRDDRLIVFAKTLGDSGKWTEQQGAEILQLIAALIRIPATNVQNSVASAIQSAGLWPPDRRLVDVASALRTSGKWTEPQSRDLLETIAPQLGLPAANVGQSVADALRSAGHWPPDTRLKEFARALRKTGKWTEPQSADILETIAHQIGIQPSQVGQSVADALTSAGQWPVPPPPPDPPATPVISPPKHPQFLKDSIAVATWRFPIWYAIVLLGIVLEAIDRWAGLAYGLTFALLAVGNGIAERHVDAGAFRRNLLWGGLNAGLAGALGLVGLIAILIAPGGPAARPAWAGEWDTDWGKMLISDGAGGVTATYESRTGSGRAELRQGKDKDNQPVLDGKWCLGASCDTATQKGLLLLVMGKDGRTFDGYFTYSLEGRVEAGDSAGNMIIGRRKAAQ